MTAKKELLLIHHVTLQFYGCRSAKAVNGPTILVDSFHNVFKQQ